MCPARRWFAGKHDVSALTEALAPRKRGGGFSFDTIRRMKKSGAFITFEGTDGVGKSTQARLLAEWLRGQGADVVETREPGGGAVAERIRGILLDPAASMSGLTELFLYEAARVEHLESVVRPAIAAEKFVICDRFTDSTLAYQGYARGLLKESEQLNQVAAQGLRPDLTLLLDHPPEKSLARAQKRAGGGDRLEGEGLAFQRRVREGFLAAAERERDRIKVVQVRPAVSDTQAEIRRLVRERFSL